MKIYPRKHLSKQLEKQGLPSSFKSLSDYEEKGVIPRSGSIEVVNKRKDRYYTQEEINSIVEKIKKHKNG